MDGDNRKTRNQGKRANNTKYPLRSRTDGGGAPPPNYGEKRERGIWDGEFRPKFTEATWKYMLAPNRVNRQQGVRGKEYQCPECGDFFHRKKNLTKQQQRDLGYITIDHKKAFRHDIYKKAAAEDDGRISSKSATAVYNDIPNLEVMCNFCNSAKNGTNIN